MYELGGVRTHGLEYQCDRRVMIAVRLRAREVWNPGSTVRHTTKHKEILGVGSLGLVRDPSDRQIGYKPGVTHHPFIHQIP